MILHSIEQGPARQDEGPAILLLHGLFGSAKNLGAIGRALGTRARVISLDIRNHGESPHAAAMDYAAMAADVAELVVLDIAPVAYHHGYDDYVAGMKSIIPTKELTRHAADAALAAYVPEPAFRSFLLNNLVLGDAPRWRVALDEIGAAMPELVAWDDPGGVFQGPALFVRGANSSYVRDESRDKILQLFPKAEMVTVAGAGHWLHAEQPKAVIAALEGFLFS
jgi:pimeloyl-ACP methyl ester carboxylesterase